MIEKYPNHHNFILTVSDDECMNAVFLIHLGEL
jgi:hypothetical protein